MDHVIYHNPFPHPTDKLMYIPTDDTQNYPVWRLQSVVEMFGHLTKWTKQSNSIKVPQDG